VRFAPADGNGRARRIIATVEQDGIPRNSLTVARYKAPPWRKPAKPRKLRVRRRGSNLVVSWRAAAGASRYSVYVTAADGERELFLVSAKKRRLKVRGVQKDDSAKVQVRGMRSDGLPGKAAKLRVRPAKKRR
jgi:hypothetical protein